MIACFAWPPLFLLVVLAVIGRLIVRAGRGSRLSAFIAGILLVAIVTGIAYMMPSYAVIVLSLGIAAGAWLVGVRVRAARSTA